MKFKNENNDVTAITIFGTQYEVVDGVVEADAEYSDLLKSYGFKVVYEAAPVKTFDEEFVIPAPEKKTRKKASD